MKPSFNRRQQAEFAKIAIKFNLDLMVLFGSQAKGNSNAISDVDIAVWPRRDLKISEYASLNHFLGEVIGNFNIDLAILKHANPLLLGQVAKNCLLLYESKKGAFQRFRIYAMKRYADAWPIFRNQALYLQHNIKKFKKELTNNGR